VSYESNWYIERKNYFNWREQFCSFYGETCYKHSRFLATAIETTIETGRMDRLRFRLFFFYKDLLSTKPPERLFKFWWLWLLKTVKKLNNPSNTWYYYHETIPCWKRNADLVAQLLSRQYVALLGHYFDEVISLIFQYCYKLTNILKQFATF